MVFEQITANKISVNTAEQDDLIESVTVFQANRAEVKRRIKLELKRGQNHIDVERLPTCVNEDSIRVEGTGDAVIFDVVYHHQPSWSTPSADDPLEQAAEECRRALEALRKERDVARQQASYLELYGKAIDNKSIGDVERFLDMFAPRQLAISKHIQELDVKIAQAEKVYSDVQARTRCDPRDASRRTKITVTVLAEDDGQVEFLLTYTVSNASWTPLYDVRASIAKSPNAPSKVTLHYRASITQTTGENWSDVTLTLSTASPQLGNTVPSLSPWRIGFIAPLSLGEMYTPNSVQTQVMGFSYSAGYHDVGHTTRSYAPPMAHRSAKVVEAGVLSASFSISGRSNIPTDEGSHKVIIGVLDLEAEPEWVCVPREQERVYLQCKVVNSSEFTLLAGEASVFMDDNFVSKTSLKHVSPNESFTTSLGVDSALRVSYPPARALNRTVNRSSFFLGNNPGQSVSARSQRITIRNTRSSSVTSLRVFDHVPVSTDVELKVIVLSPKSLDPIREVGEAADEAKNKEHPWAYIKTGVKARWASLDVGGDGTVEWECQVQPNQELELELAWEIDAPMGRKWEDK